jgi:hypothetical protein
MLHRVLAGFCSLPGVEQAFLFDNLGCLIASVGDAGEVPSTDSADGLVKSCKMVTEAASAGTLEEIWCEGSKRMIIDRIRSDLILVLEGKGGQLARWRHSIDRDRALIAEIA